MIDETKPRAVGVANCAIAIVTRFYGMGITEFKGEQRSSRHVRARWAVIWLLTRNSRLSMSGIGRVINRDHSTVINARKRALRVLGRDAEMLAEFKALEIEVIEALRRNSERLAAAEAVKIEIAVQSAIQPPPPKKPPRRMLPPTHETAQRARAAVPAPLMES